MSYATRFWALVLILAMALVLGACASGGSSYSRVSYGLGMGYGSGYYGHSPYGYYRPPPAVVVVPDRPVAMPFDPPGGGFGMPDAGFDDFGDFGGFD